MSGAAAAYVMERRLNPMGKKMIAVGLVVGTILLFGGSRAAAQEPSPMVVARDAVRQTTPSAAPLPLTVDAAVRIALDRNPVTRAAAEGIRVAEEAAGEARAPYFPTLSVAASYVRWETHAFLPDGLVGSTIPATIGPTDDWTAALTGRYTLV